MSAYDDFIAATASLTETAGNVADLVDELYALQTGTANGGPNGDGRYPLTDRQGVVRLVLCPAAVAALSPSVRRQIYLTCFADSQVVYARTSVAWIYALEPMNLIGVRGQLAVPGTSAPPSGSIICDVRVNNVSIFGTSGAPQRLTILGQQRSSLASGTPQPLIVNPYVPDNALIEVDVVAEGVAAQGLRVALIGESAV